jgi:hypothetical protein
VRTILAATLVAAMPVLAASPPVRGEPRYAWRDGGEAGAATLGERIAAPAGFVRVPVEPGGWAEWLRGLPLKPADAPLLLYNGARKPRQDVHAAIVAIDVGRRDLQQCADAILRLRAEWLWSTGRTGAIAFDYTGGGRVDFTRWAQGLRPSPDGKRWSRSGGSDTSYASFRRYMDAVFTMAGTYSLERELKPAAIDDLRIGDVFIKGGFPGHGVLVVDMAHKPGTSERRFLLLQSFMPAQEMHILKNPATADGSPWYAPDFGDRLVTPEWTFPRGSLRRFP